MKRQIDGSTTSTAVYGAHQASTRDMSDTDIVVSQDWRQVAMLASQSDATTQPRAQGWTLPRPRRWSIPQPRRWRGWRPRNWTTRRWEKHLLPVPVYVGARER